MSQIRPVFSGFGLTLAAILTIAVAVSPFLPGQDKGEAARVRLRQYTANSARANQLLENAPQIGAGKVRRIQGPAGDFSVELRNVDGELEVGATAREYWVRLPDGRQAVVHVKVTED